MIASMVSIIIFVVLAMLKMPVSATMGVAVIISLIGSGHSDALYVVPQRMIDAVMSPSLLAIPFFILAASIMNATELTDQIFDFASSLVGHIKGGLAQVNVVASMIFAGCSGSALADVGGLGKIEIKAMKKKGYSGGFAAAVTVASAACGPIIPPSIPLVIYAYIANVSVARLFLAGVVPGVLIGLSLMILCYILSFLIKDFPLPEKRASLSQVLKSFWRGGLALFTPIIIIVGLVGGFTTAAEAGILAAMYALVIGIKVKGLGKMLKLLPNIFYSTAITTIIIMFIIATASALAWLIALERVPFFVADSILSITENRLIFLLLVNIFLLFLGTIVSGTPALLIMAPIFIPLADHFGVSRVQFGLIMVYGIIIGIATPPMGICLYIGTKIANIKFEEMIKAIVPFWIPLIIVLLLISFYPPFTLFLPNLIMGK